ncbi:MAG: hypothetical protein WA210_21400 [Burkholderiaceae bacterium]
MKLQLLALIGALATAAAGATLADAKFSHLAVRVEQNATDKDFEVVFEATGGDTGLASLQVAAPDGRVVIDFKAPNKLGMRTIRLETPEPKLLAGLQADFPAGKYMFTANTVAGSAFSGSATLSHKLPGTASQIRPGPEDQNVPVNGLRLRWAAPKDLAACLVTIENEAGVKVVQAALAGSATTFSVPDRLLVPAAKYIVAIGTVGRDGNASYVETSFRTAAK